MALKEIRCVRCGSSALQIKSESLQCQHCDTSYHLLHGVPILFPDAIVHRSSEKPSEAFISSLIDAMSLPKDSDTITQLQEVFSKTYQFGDFLLDAENQFLLRLKACGIDIAESELPQPPPLTSQKQKAQREVNPLVPDLLKTDAESEVFEQEKEVLPRYRWVLDYLPRSMQTNLEFTGNVRIENIGSVPITSNAIAPAMASYHWRTESGEIAIFDGCRTPFPIELSAGQQLTLPVKIRTP
ncbi:hypothetical protein IQ250_24505 [Pseudanabaenaceae cyanobacterium LEGE 13415]|nr:hypothetical protein [Pseudanabaenaceae cyanobacterium LEGE 13415]